MAMWMMPKCRNVEVKRRHRWWSPMVAGSKSPPHLNTSSGVGCVKETPLATMAKEIRMLIAIRTNVMVYGLRERGWRDDWVMGSEMAMFCMCL
jgi:hypothetical protein